MESIELIQIKYKNSFAMQILLITEFFGARNMKEQKFLSKFFQKLSNKHTESLEEKIVSSIGSDLTPDVVFSQPLRISCESKIETAFQKRFEQWVNKYKDENFFISDNWGCQCCTNYYEIETLPKVFFELYQACKNFAVFEITERDYDN
ncbi:MAG: hypothetical protein H7Y04_12040 [Verrucomicrobia bacterium]|nr:hypothetical protein [Cytophagales bacterium]